MTSPVAAERFFTPESHAEEQSRRMEPPRGKLLIASCRGGAYLAHDLVARYRELTEAAGGAGDVADLASVDSSFADGETRVRLESHVSGCDVFLVQVPQDPTGARTVGENLLAFLIAARAFREHGASHVTGVLPCLPFARQDKPSKFRREPTTARLVADLCLAAGVDRVLTWEPHSSQVRGFFGVVPVTVIDALALFVREFDAYRGARDVIAVAPDAGASKLVTHFGRALGIRCAIASKFRAPSGDAEITEIIGDFSGVRVAIILDDMISSAGTLAALVEKLARATALEEIRVAASHNLGVGPARARLADLHARFPLRQVIVTDSVPQPEAVRRVPGLVVRSLAEPLARAVNRIHFERSVSEAFVGPARGV